MREPERLGLPLEAKDESVKRDTTRKLLNAHFLRRQA